MNISFSLTTQQIRDHSKTVTRRLGWSKLRPGMILTACEKCQGLKKGEHPVILGRIEVTSVARERLGFIIDAPTYGKSEVILEGFPKMTPAQFVSMFCEHNKCDPSRVINRIEFEYL
jgi:hypothetical protein